MKKGFTLVELLVVIAIIAILAAVIFPVLSRTREKARQSSCLSNIKQLTTALVMYHGDHDEMFPPSGPGWWTGTQNDPGNWYFNIWPYLDGSRKVLHCPSNTSDIGYYMACRPSATLTPRTMLSEVSLICDGAGVAWGYGAAFEMAPNPADVWGGTLPPCGGGRYHSVNPVHNGGANLGYADGHGQWKQATPYPGTSYYYITGSRWW